ncbi:RED-like protein N-terminal region-domain-containing protein [Coprinopsis sp. MPI-PUGE-AT-0042]|nr:RED-like protein N-terminal region-domain-containing protein [Coprinopsis sp. MPI-PUGE-AT-0042]
MNQEEFRSLLSKPGAASSSRGAETSSRGSKPSKSKSKAVDSSQPAFKPRKVKPEASTEGGKYRDRATERRLGKDGDFAHVEAVLNEFEKRAQDGDPDIEEKRKYLGGDSEHSVLVKGLDFALLEQNKARLAAETDVVDDDTLEQAFTEVVAKPPKKRTREDLIRELKEKRGGGGTSAGDVEPPTHSREEGARVLEEAKQQGKFKPIGFKPIGESEGKKKKKKAKEDGKDSERKKKKRKVEGEGLGEVPMKEESQVKLVESEEPTKPSAPSAQPPPEPEPTNDDFDIFADAGEYTGLDIDEEEDEAAGPQKEEGELDGDGAPPRRWIDMDEDPVLHRKRSEPPRLADEEESSSAPGRNFDEDEDMEVDERPMRLAPLESSALPDIKELLQMDKASSSWSKNKKKKDKKKATGGGDEPGKVSEAKIERDYQRLKAYTDKKK